MFLLQSNPTLPFSFPDKLTNPNSPAIQEALRMYPPRPSRRPPRPTPGGQTILGAYIPQGIRISVHHSTMSLSPKNFFSPDQYDPERWLPSDDADYPYRDDQRDALQPFSYGPRDCIGRNMAWHEVRLLAAKLLLPLDLELCEESRGWRDQKVRCIRCGRSHRCVVPIETCCPRSRDKAAIPSVVLHRSIYFPGINGAL